MTDSDRILASLLELHPKLIDLSLGRIERLLAALGNPQDHLPPVIHIAGTNGKGSVAAMLGAGLRHGGARVHVYTSPHLVHFQERIVLAGRRITEARLCRLLVRCRDANQDAPITFFEITTAAAFLGFAETPADYCLLEVGLGGRLDATNVVPAPALTVITRVGHDHHEYLGTTLPKIASEKAGILKPGVPCIVGPQPRPALGAIERRAGVVGAPLLRHGIEWTCLSEADGMIYSDREGALALSRPALRGAHQIENAGIAVAALRKLGAGSPCAALRARNWPARLQRLRHGPIIEALPEGAEVWLDGGHNADAAKALAREMRGRGGADGCPLYLICGMLETKDTRAFLGPFAGLAARVFAVNLPRQHKGLSASALAGMARAAGLPAVASTSPEKAAARIGALSRRPRVLVCGSLYLAGEVLKQAK